jgi:hypothetical protein
MLSKKWLKPMAAIAAGTRVPSYASIIWIRFLGRQRSRVALSAFAPRCDAGWLPCIEGNIKCGAAMGQERGE